MAQEIADSTLLDTWGSGGNIVEPDISKIIEGWQLGEQPPHEYMNWLQNTFGSKINHILKNGVASWNNKTEYLADSSVQHNGNVWLCKTTNTNSEPADVNANWKRIITVESLTTVLGGYVKNSENETINGIKTFSSSPIVPTPTTSGNVITMDNIIQKTAVGIGYGTGSGGIVTQLTNKATTVTLNKPSGRITMNNAYLPAGGTATFTFINNLIEISDSVLVTLAGGFSQVLGYQVWCNVGYSGGIEINVKNIYSTTLSESIIIDFKIIKGATS